MMTRTELNEICAKYGADKVGVAPIARFAAIQPAGNPIHILPSVQSVIVLLHSIPRGWTRGAESHSDWATAYTRGGFLDSSLTIEITYNICTQLENRGFDAVPLYNYPLEMRTQGVQVKPGVPAPDVVPDGYLAAHLAGLGQFGKCGLFLTPEFGTRQQFTMILTNAVLDGDEIVETSICDGCGQCAAHCYAHAISADQTEPLNREGFDVTVYRRDAAFCSACKSGVLPNSFWASAEGDRTLAACGRACMAHLEDTGALKYAFHNKYRREHDA